MTNGIVQTAPAEWPQVRLEVQRGDYAQACRVCAGRPCAIRVRSCDEDFETEEKLGLGGVMECRDYYFCAEHESAADELVRLFRS
jgi:hypothetical protein